MIVAKVTDGAIVDLQDYRTMFPDTSFPVSGPNNDFFQENGLFSVNQWKDHDMATQRLVPAVPYIEDGKVYTVVVEAIPEPEPVVEPSGGGE